ncbi:hypothetical protein ASPZODRAFT_75286 [Penicilliopsis zonata CBS 506.65]|uniref:Cytochrome oxidase c assembly-domain-containing protein n=1 Tax=Penicilliopsis zonata CBS 506.65 TaxID=1073090 RepID=A0A1L9S742_9EURO|nr:hypothetical protein ASPZODRAFT_75286 [Penicilliopsis zonata CBS 506.65]OJJ42975.1 hypothetical protein ASPZODRAFT_75286 [Penicilliopsis zonata CBS 506.65]
MSRSAADATRFTATGPYANSKAGSSPSTPYKLPAFMSSPGQKGQGDHQETPREKVERLRAQARAARLAQSTNNVDSMIDRGRRIANKAHKAMVYTLIAASGICGALTVYSVISLTLYNRRQKALWLDRELERLREAQTAAASGTATAEQLEMVKNEQIGQLYQQKKEEEKAKRPWNQMKTYLFGGLKSEESTASTTTTTSATASTSSIQDAAAQTNSPVLNALNAKAIQDARLADSSAASASAPATAQAQGHGQLDALAENAEQAVKQTSRSWKSWLTGR